MIHESWCYHLSSILPQYIEAVNTAGDIICPKKENVFNVFTMGIDDINVVLLGQDPYPTPGMAIGYAFAINSGFSKPPSLRIIEKEIGHEVKYVSLAEWITQGIFLLNTALTINCKNKKSHISVWKPFISTVISILAKKDDIVWLMLGNYAKQWVPKILKINRNAVIVSAPHPAAEVYKKNAGFLGSGVFTKVNDKLIEMEKKPINW